MKTTHEPTHVTLRLRDPLCLIRSFADSMAEGLLGPEDIGALYHAIAYAEDEIRPLLSLPDHLLDESWQGRKTGTERAGVASDCHRRAA